MKIKLKIDRNGRRFRSKTREGQVCLSRHLSVVESRIFWRGAFLRLWRECGIPSVPIHDCLLTRTRDAEQAKALILEQAERVLGFVPVVKVQTPSKANEK